VYTLSRLGLTRCPKAERNSAHPCLRAQSGSD